jgi:hypothetical protein
MRIIKKERLSYFKIADVDLLNQPLMRTADTAIFSALFFGMIT